MDRILFIHQKIREATESKHLALPNCSSLASELECNPKTVQRDIDFMRERLRLPMEFDPVSKGFIYTGSVSDFPLLQISTKEIFSLIVAKKVLAQYKGTPFEAPLHSVFSKMGASLTGVVSMSWADLDQALSFHSIGASLMEIEVFQQVCQATAEQRELEFDYRKIDSTKFERRRVKPYHVANINSQWYLFCLDMDKDQERTFVLSRMRSPKASSTRFTSPKNFSVEQRLKNSFGVFSGDKPQTVRIRFDRFAATLVRERSWHPKPQFQELSGGELEMEMQLGSLNEIEGWILSWGAHATVLAPAELKKRIAKAAASIRDKYR